MNKRQKFKALLVCIALFAAALMLSFFLSRDDVGDFHGGGTGHIVLSEILASNKTYPNPAGQYLDYVEIRNLTATPTDISGYMISDALDSIGYAFPKGTVLPAYGYITVWCDPLCDTGEYAAFGISRDMEETVYLYNSANVMVDSVTLPRMRDNMPLIRSDSGDWEQGTQASPGYENTPEGYEKWLSSMGAGKEMSLVISEVMTANDCTALDDSGRITDWVELWNTGKKDLSLDAHYLSDDPMNAFKWQIPQLTIPAGGRALIRCAGSEALETEADFALPRSGCTLVLTGTLGNTISQITVPALGRDISWALQSDGSYAPCAQATPGFENSAEGYAKWLSAVNPRNIQVVISEVMASNCSTVLNQAGDLCDWVELKNVGSQAADLSGCFLSDDPDKRALYSLDNLVIQPGETALVLCSGADADPGEATFALSKSGCTLTLTGPSGNLLASLEVPALDDDRSYALQSDGSYLQTHLATPGFENTQAGREAFLLSQTSPGPLAITEVMPSNASYLRQDDGKCYDWVELQNISSAPVDLSGYCLSNDKNSPRMMTLPQKILEPGERIVIICSGDAELSGKHIYAPFTLSREECWVYLTHVDGGFCDYVHVYDVPYQGSVGKVTGQNGTYYFTKPTPGTDNSTGVAFICDTPVLQTPDGVYNDVKDVEVSFTGSGEIRYTLDGNIPTANSPLYTGPIRLSATTVVRAASFENGKLPSDVVTAAYIINENHTLPVISVAVEPDDMFGGAGIHTNYHTEKEIPCNVKLFDGTQGFSIDCGIKMFGHMGLTNPKKSFKINFRGRYGEDFLTYPVYGEDAPQYFDSLIVRSGQDYPFTIFRDELFTTLARETGDNILAQRHKFCILYINGRYWGIYTLKEAFSETMIATNYGISQESVEIVQAPVDADTEMFRLMKYCWDNDMTDPQVWEYVTSQVDVDSIIDWIIMEGYSTNSDTQQNLRYFRSPELGEGGWHFAYYDIDWGWWYNIQFKPMLSPKEKLQHTALTRNMMENPEFRERFLTRLSELMATTLSNEHVHESINSYVELLEPEVRRERDRWDLTYDGWLYRLQEMRDFLDDNHLQKMINSLREYIGLTNEEARTYFGRWIQ